MKCKHCQSEIDPRAKVCPVCRRKQSSDGLIIFLVLLGCFLFLCIGIPFFKGFMSGVKGETSTPSVSTPAAPAETPTEAPEAVILYDKDNVKISYLNTERNDRRAKINLLIENDSEKNLMIQTDDMSINGYMVTPFFSSHVSAGKKIYDAIDVLNSTLEKSGISDIKDIEFTFDIVNDDDWKDQTKSEPVKIAVS